MEFARILKKIQKKQRMLLKVLISGALEPDQEGRLARIASGLRLMGVVDNSELSLTSKGREFVAGFGDLIFQEIHLDTSSILDKLLQRAAPRPEPNQKLSKRERLFLTFLFDGPVDIRNVRGAKNLIPHLLDLGK